MPGAFVGATTAALGHGRWRSPRFPDLEPSSVVGNVVSKDLSIF